MPKTVKKKKQEKEQEIEKDTETDEAEQKTSIQITTKVRDRLWRLKFRKTYDEFLWELCSMFEEAQMIKEKE